VLGSQKITVERPRGRFLAGDRSGIPIGWITAPANRNDCKLVTGTLDQIAARGLLVEIDTIHMDRRYDFDFVRNDCHDRGIGDVQIPRRRGLRCV
jgi:hypothetical protein